MVGDGARAWWRENHGGVVALEHACCEERCSGMVALERVRLCGHDSGVMNGEERRWAHEQIRLREQIHK
jgi:hypothetical protein